MQKFLKVGEVLFCMLGFALAPLHAQQPDTLTVRRLSDVEVVARQRPSVAREGAPLQVLDRAGFERLGMSDLSEAVKRFSGVTVQDYGGIGGLKTVSVRSLGAKHTAVSYDGMVITDAQSGQVDISRFSLDNVETVALSVGQSDDIFQTARMYASAGALRIRSRKPQFDEKSMNLRVQVKGGSFGLFNPAVRYEQRLGRRFAASFHTDWLSAKGEYPFTLTNGELVTRQKRLNSDIQSYRLEGNVYGDLGKGGKLQGKLYYYDSERGLPGSVILYNTNARERLWDTNFFGQMQYVKSAGERLEVKAQLKYNYSYSKYRDTSNKYEGGVQIDRNTQQEYYSSAGVLYRPFGGFSLSFMQDVALNRLVNNFVNAPQPKRLTSLSVVAAQYKTTRLTATASLLATYLTDRVTVGETPADRKRLSPAASVSVRPFAESAFRLRASYQSIFRVPTFTDLYYLRMGNTNLRPERATQYNLGLTWGGETACFRYLSFSADGYANRVEDKIVAIPTMYISKMMNLGKVDIKGVDVNLSAEVPLTERMVLFVSASYSWQRAIDVTDPHDKNYRDQIPYTPRHAGTAACSWENPWVNVSYRLTAAGQRFALPQNTEANRIGSYIEQGVSLNRSFRVGKCGLRVEGEVLNLGSRTYDIIQYYPMPGRSWRLGITVNY